LSKSGETIIEEISGTGGAKGSTASGGGGGARIDGIHLGRDAAGRNPPSKGCFIKRKDLRTNELKRKKSFKKEKP